MDGAKSYIVCSTPRSGSTLLCQLLVSTGVAGRPEEYFEARAETGLPPHPGDYLTGLPRTGAGVRDDPTPPHAPAHSDLRGLTFAEHLERTLRLGTTANGVFGTKLMWRHLPELTTLAATLPGTDGLTQRALLDHLLGDPVYVWMRRRDKVRQAISLWRALQTRTWRLEQTGGSGDTDAPRLMYSFDAIDHLARSLTVDDDAWGRFFDAEGIAPLEISYEDDLERDRTGTIARVLERLGVAVPSEWSPTETMSRQSDALNDQWAAAYQATADEHRP